MQFIPSPFSYDKMQLTFKDVLKLLIGKQLQDGPVLVRAYRMPTGPELKPYMKVRKTK